MNERQRIFASASLAAVAVVLFCVVLGGRIGAYLAWASNDFSKAFSPRPDVIMNPPIDLSFGVAIPVLALCAAVFIWLGRQARA